MDKYIIVKLSPKTDDLSEEAFRIRSGKIRKALHAAYDSVDLHGADLVVGTQYQVMSDEDANTVAKIFERTMNKWKRVGEFQKKYGFFPTWF